MMKVFGFTLAVALCMSTAVECQAGCGLLRRGGCSDPCAAAACGGFGVSSCAACSAGGEAGGCATCGAAQATGCASCGMAVGAGSGNCSACAATQTVAGMTYYQTYQPSAAVITQSEELMDCGPITSYKVVMEPSFVTETRIEPVTEYQNETRYRTRVVPRQVAVEVQDYRATTNMVSRTETKIVEYSVLVPQQQEKTVTLKEMVPVWNEVTDSYQVRVPNVVDVPEEYTVRVPKVREEQFTYTVQVPKTQTETKLHTFTNAVPVTKTRTVMIQRPVTRMETVTRDYGHWEIRVEEAAAPIAAPMPSSNFSIGGCGTYSGNCSGCGGCGRVYSSCGNTMSSMACGSCGGCGVQQSCAGCGQSVYGASGCSACSSSTASYAMSGMDCQAVASAQTISRRVWVPNVVTEEVPVVENVSQAQEVTYTAFEQQTEQVPYECTYIVYAPEQRTGTRQVVDYVNETRTRNRKVVQYTEETRTRTRKELSYKEETRTETVPFVTYSTEKKTKEVSYTVSVPETKLEPVTTTRFDTVNEEVTEEYTVRVPVAGTREVQVQVCKMVPKVVPVTIYPCSSAGQQTIQGSVGGCTTCGSPTPAAPYVVPGNMIQNKGCASCSGSGCAGCIQ